MSPTFQSKADRPEASGSDSGRAPASVEPTPAVELETELRRAADSPLLLVVSDFDGVLAPFVDDPSQAAALPEAMASLEKLAELPGTWVALVSGRGRDDLAARSGASTAIELVGSHGSEWSEGFLAPMGPEEATLLNRVVDALTTLSETIPGTFVEVKLNSAAIHYRTAETEADRERARREALTGPGSWPGVHVTAGKNVVELAVVETSKGTALKLLAERVAASASTVASDGPAHNRGSGSSKRVVTVFCGDDVTDEKGFVVLNPTDLGIKVGSGETAARLRIADIPAVCDLYARLAELRANRQL